MEIRPLGQDLSIYNKFNFTMPPVGVKFSLSKPEGMEQLDEEHAFCEMFKVAQQKEKAFYITKENENCSGKMPLGWMGEMPAWAESGMIGDKFEIFQEPRANKRLYDRFYKFKPGLINYVAFARLDNLTFEPDVLILTTKPSQAEIVLRAMTYSTGELWQAKDTPVLGCSWLYIYPYISGNVNYSITGMHFGMKAREVLPEGYILVSIPYNWIATITQNLQEMKWVLPAYSLGREKWLEKEKESYEELAQTYGDK